MENAGGEDQNIGVGWHKAGKQVGEVKGEKSQEAGSKMRSLSDVFQVTVYRLTLLVRSHHGNLSEHRFLGPTPALVVWFTVAKQVML